MLTEEKTKIEVLIDNLKDYLITRMDLAMLKGTEKGAIVVSNLVACIVLSAIFLFFILFASFALAIGLSEKFNSGYAGFLIVAGIYLIIGIILLLVQKKTIKEPISDLFIKQMLKEEKSDR